MAYTPCTEFSHAVELAALQRAGCIPSITAELVGPGSGCVGEGPVEFAGGAPWCRPSPTPTVIAATSTTTAPAAPAAHAPRERARERSDLRQFSVLGNDALCRCAQCCPEPRLSVHAHLAPFKANSSAASARDAVDFTVPREMPIDAAISPSSSSDQYRRTRTSR